MRARLFLFFFAASALTACVGTTSIGDILAHPREYAGRSVTVQGEVKNVFSLLVIKYFTLDDGTGSIIVVTERPLPKNGERIKVKGRVEEAFSLGEQTLTLIIEADERSSRSEEARPR